MLGTDCYIGQQKTVGRPKNSTSRPKKERSKPRRRLIRTSLHQSAKHSHAPSDFVLLHGADSTMLGQDRLPITEITEDFPNLSVNLDFNYGHMRLPTRVNDLLDEESALETSSPKSQYQSPFIAPVVTNDSEDHQPLEAQFEAEISRMYSALQNRGALIMSVAQSLDFNAIVYRNSPLSLDKITLASFAMTTSESFLQILERLQHSLQDVEGGWRHHDKRMYSEIARSHSASIKHPSSSLAAGITSVFGRLLSIFELMVDRIVERLQRLDLGPPDDMPDLMPQDGSVKSACTQGIFYCNRLHHILDRTEHVLGIHQDQLAQRPGILSDNQIEILEGVIDEYTGFGSGQGIMRPADTKRLLRQIAGVLKQTCQQSNR